MRNSFIFTLTVELYFLFILDVVIIGSGNLATNLSLALLAVGTNIKQVYSPTLSHAQALASQLVCPATNTFSDIVRDADVYIVAIKDDEIPNTIANLRKGRDGSVILHTAGSVPMADASPTGVLYPMQTFSKKRKVNFREIPVFIEATDVHTLNIIRTLAQSISNRVIELSSAKRRQLHLAAVFANNFTNHCYRLAEKSLEGTDLDFSVLLPLIMETARKVSDLSPREAQTGPMKRNDTTVMAKQLELIPDELTRQLYSTFATSIFRDQ